MLDQTDIPAPLKSPGSDPLFYEGVRQGAGSVLRWMSDQQPSERAPVSLPKYDCTIQAPTNDIADVMPDADPKVNVEVMS